jgi:MFS family permease
MALVMAASAIASQQVARRIGAHRSTGLAMFLMAIGIASVALLGKDARYIELMPSFIVIGIGGGLSVPLTDMVLGAMPASQAGVASGIFNAAREVAGLLGITVIGAIITARQGRELSSGHSSLDAFLSGYREGLLVAGLLVALGGIAAFFALRGADERVEHADDAQDELALVA